MIKEKRINICENYSFINEVNGLCIIDLEKENQKVLLCACKKYTKKQKNGILLINTELLYNEELTTNFIEIDSFEVNCFCQINIKENNKNTKTNYVLVGGLDTEKREGIIKLCKLIKINDNIFNIEILEDIFIGYTKDFEGFQGSINCIVQSKNNCKILVGCLDGKVYTFSEPNINIYLEEDKELEDSKNELNSVLTL